MVRRWRLRHKLLLGLALVLASIGLLLLGTMRGLTSFVTTMNATDSRLVELQKAQLAKKAIAQVANPAPQPQGLLSPTPANEHEQFTRRLQVAKEAFAEYQRRYSDTRQRGRDPEPYEEDQLIRDIQASFQRLEDAVGQASKPRASTRSRPLVEEPEIRSSFDQLLREVNQLEFTIAADIWDGIDQARGNYRWSSWVVGIACSLAVLLMLVIAHLFRKWVFHPIRQIQEGVYRVSNADFDHPIQLRSGDELQQLSDAFNDMTQRLRAIYQDLAQQVNERSKQLVRSERMVSVGFLAAGVAHEINNPLASIAFCSEALDRRMSRVLAHVPGEGEEIQKYLKMIEQEAFRCKEITQRLLEFSRAGERRRERTNLSELIQGVLEIARHLENCRGKHLVFRPLQRPLASVNAPDLKSVVLNLVVNALDSMEANGTLTITLESTHDDAVMTFTDTGCGMDQEVMQNLFEPFFTRSRTGKGTGLGLFISHQIIDQHGGKIDVSSAGKNQGSTFVVTVPLQAVEQDDHPLPMEQRWARPPARSNVTEDGLGHAAA